MNIPIDNYRYPLVITKEYLSKYLSFNHELQDNYKDIVAKLLSLLGINEKKKRKLQQRHLESKLRNLELIIINLITKTNLDINQQVFISYRAQSFTDSLCSYRQFIDIMNVLEMNGLIIRVKGKKQTNPFNNKVWIYYKASTLSITNKFINLCCCVGIHNLTYNNFIKVCLPKYFITARYASENTFGKKFKGKKASLKQLKKTSEFGRLNKEMESINMFLNKQKIINANFYGLVRNFNLFNEQYCFNFGGRMQAIGKENFQTLKKQERSKILINNIQTEEVDIKASHLTIFHALLGVQIKNEDPYYIKDMHRDIVKEWVNISLSNCKYCDRWPTLVKQRLLTKGHQLKKLSAKEAGKIILKNIPILKKLNASTSGWAFLQFVESDILIKALISLKELDITALPVHDSLIVQENHLDKAKKILSDTFLKKLGMRPMLK
tara:strand:+ start:56 stop:1366 length:1311 start_codon:yes stop_codon:yes gene_type:complete